MVEAMLINVTIVETTKNFGGSTIKTKCEPTQQNWMKKSQNMLVWLKKMVWLNIRLQIAMSGKWHKGPPTASYCKYDLTSSQYL